MNAFIQRIIDAVPRWLEQARTWKAARKKFIIQRILKNEPEPDLRKRKTFLVEKIDFFNWQSGNDNNGSGKFRVAGKTRPKQCPYCRTQNDLEQQSDRKCRCRTCNYKW